MKETMESLIEELQRKNNLLTLEVEWLRAMMEFHEARHVYDELRVLYIQEQQLSVKSSLMKSNDEKEEEKTNSDESEAKSHSEVASRSESSVNIRKQRNRRKRKNKSKKSRRRKT